MSEYRSTKTRLHLCCSQERAHGCRGSSQGAWIRAAPKQARTRRVLHAVVEGGQAGVVIDHHVGAHALRVGPELVQGRLGPRRVVDGQIGVLCVGRQQVLDERRLACAGRQQGRA